MFFECCFSCLLGPGQIPLEYEHISHDPSLPASMSQVQTPASTLVDLEDDDEELIPFFAKGDSPEAQKYREKERERRRRDGNDHRREKAATGRRLDDFLASTVIVIRTNNSKNKIVKYYYCVGCDTGRANNASARALPHASQCAALARLFPGTHNEAERLAGNSSLEGVLTGLGAAPAVRPKKRKIEKANEGRSDTVGIRQVEITESFGPRSLTAKQQSLIDFLLLRFIICCSLAFSLLDNGFFIDFCNILYVLSQFMLYII